MSPSFSPYKLVALGSMLPAVLAGPLSQSKRQDDTAEGPLVGALPECADEMAKKFQPTFDFDTDSCYNSAAVDGDGNVNPGRDQCSIGEDIESPDRICRQQAYLDNSNVYYRMRGGNGWTAILYGYYMEVDDTGGKFCTGGHRHDWEHVVVWVKDDAVQYVSASAHGGYDTKKSSDIEDWGWDSDHVKIVYHKDGDGTHAMRYAKEDDNDPVENHNGEWYLGSLISYHGLLATNENAFNAMMDNDWGSATIDFKDSEFKSALDKAKPDDVDMDTGADEDGQSSPC